MPTLGGAAPTLVVSVTADDYTTGRGWAHVDGIDDAPVSLTTARHTACGGSKQAFLPTKNGKVVAACLRTDLNPHAPDVILCDGSASARVL